MIRLAKVRVSWRAAWVIPTALGAAFTAYLAWGAWISAQDPHWLYLSQAWWRIWLRPGNDQAPLAITALWLVASLCDW